MYPQSDMVSILKSIPWFLDLKSEILARLSRICCIREVCAGEELFVEGGKDDYLYIVMEGQFSLDILVPNCGRMQVYTADLLDIVGWSSLTPVVRQRTSSARAVVDTKVLAIDAPGLLQLCNEDDHLGYMVMRRIANTTASRLLNTRIQLLTRLARYTNRPELPQPDFE